MKKKSSLFLCLLFAGCAPFDPVQRAADEADRTSRSASAQSTMGVFAQAGDSIEKLYYSQKYPGDPAQVAQAIAKGKELMKKRRAQMNRVAGANPAQAQKRQQEEDRYFLIGLESKKSNSEIVAIYDSEYDKIVGNNLYEIDRKVENNQRIKFDDCLVRSIK